MTLLFKCSTNEGFMFKVLGEILHNTFKSFSLNIDEKGITSQISDTKKSLLINFKLEANNFSQWHFTTKMLFGIHVSLFHRAISSVKKKDIVSFEIYKENPHELVINVIPKDKEHLETTKISINPVQSIDFEVPTNYDHPIHISSNKIQKIFKDINNTGKRAHILGNKYFVRMCSETPNIINKGITFGELKEENNVSDYYFDSEKLVKISKISSFSTYLKIFLDRNLPLVIQSNIGALGSISIYMKSDI